MLTDGANTQGVDPVTAAKQAAARHIRDLHDRLRHDRTRAVRVRAEPGQQRQLRRRRRLRRTGGGGGGFGGGGFGGGRNVQDLDANELQQVAAITGGKYFQAKDAKALSDTLMNLPSAITLQHRREELTVWFALAGALLVLAAVGLTQWWSRPRPPSAVPG